MNKSELKREKVSSRGNTEIWKMPVQEVVKSREFVRQEHAFHSRTYSFTKNVFIHKKSTYNISGSLSYVRGIVVNKVKPVLA